MTTTEASTFLHIKGFNEAERWADFIASSEELDSSGEVIEQSWKLGRYLANPVVLFAHKSGELPVGQATNVGIIDGKLQCRVVFASKQANPRAEEVWQCVRERVLRSLSVGYLVGDYRYEKRDGREVFVSSNNELFEISVVPIPANPDALLKMRACARKEFSMATDNAAPQARTENDIAQKATEVASLNAKLLELATERDSHALKLGEALAEKAALATERDLLRERLKAADVALVEKDLEQLVGVKITVEEKANLLELATVSRPLFEKSLATARAKPDLNLLGTVIPAEKKEAAPQPSTGQDQDGAGLAALANKTFKTALPISKEPAPYRRSFLHVFITLSP